MLCRHWQPMLHTSTPCTGCQRSIVQSSDLMRHELQQAHEPSLAALVRHTLRGATRQQLAWERTDCPCGTLW